MPREIQFALKGTITDERTGGQTTQAAVILPLLEFNNQVPMYAAELFQIYRLARITAIHVQLEVVNTSATAPLTAVMCCLPLVRANSITDPRGMAHVPNAISKQAGLSTGMSRVVLNKTYISQKELGQSILSGSEFYQSYSEALAPATNQDFPAIYCGVIASQTGANWTGIMKYVITYHVEFTEFEDTNPTLLKPPSSKKKISKDLEEEMDEEEDFNDKSWVEPTPSSRAKMRAALEGKTKRDLKSSK